MDPCPFVRLIIESLSLKLPASRIKPGGPEIHPYSTPCFCRLELKYFPSQTALLPLFSDSGSSSAPDVCTSAPGFHLDAASLRRLTGKPVVLRVSVYSGRKGNTCLAPSSKLLGRVHIRVDFSDAVTRSCTFHTGWVKLGDDRGGQGVAKIHMLIRAEPDPRFIFRFGGEPECSPVVFQVQGNVLQPVFSCKFSADRNSRPWAFSSDSTPKSSRGWMRTFSSERERAGKERKGWMIMIYDLSGSAIAAASMITPFVPSPGSDCVSRSNPGAWLILRPNDFSVSSWKPWGRLEAWRERCSTDRLGYKFEIVTGDGASDGILIAEATMSVKKGGQFCIDGRSLRSTVPNFRLPSRGFVMCSTVEGEGKESKPVLQVGVQHVTCMADAALFVALSAAIDLSMDACRPFSQKLRKELCQDGQET